jgi:hypothetical protein
MKFRQSIIHYLIVSAAHTESRHVCESMTRPRANSPDLRLSRQPTERIVGVEGSHIGTRARFHPPQLYYVDSSQLSECSSLQDGRDDNNSHGHELALVSPVWSLAPPARLPNDVAAHSNTLP